MSDSERLSLTTIACTLLLGGCYEIPPRLPDTNNSQAQLYTPLPYEPTPLAPSHRWFERSFQEPELPAPTDNAVLPALTALPLPTRAGRLPSECAELISLLESIASDAKAVDLSSGDHCREVVSAASLHADLLAHAALLTTTDELCARQDLRTHLAEASASAVRATAGAVTQFVKSGLGDGNCVPSPPPLRTGKWRVGDPVTAPGLLPSAPDLRWTQRWVRAEGERREAVLIRQRVAVTTSGEVLLTNLPSECWQLVEENGSTTPVVWRFDRALSRAGEDPWVRLETNTWIRLAQPVVGKAEGEGTVLAVCGGCHRDGTRPKVQGANGRPDPLAAAREVVREVLEG